MNNNYYSHPSGLQCQDFKHYLPSSIGDALKYIWRAGKKLYPNMNETESALADFDKALNYLNYCKEHGVPEVNAEVKAKLSSMLKTMYGGRGIDKLTYREALISILVYHDVLYVKIMAVEMAKELIQYDGHSVLERVD